MPDIVITGDGTNPPTLIRSLGDDNPPVSGPGGWSPGVDGQRWAVWAAVRYDYHQRHGFPDPPDWLQTGG
jgi:hypothetical protein